MKFSYPLIKRLVPGVRSKTHAVQALTMHAFEAEDAPRDTFEVSLPANRYGDAASHWGIARELSAILDTPLKLPPSKNPFGGIPSAPKEFSVTIQNSALCPRYTACSFDTPRIESSPRWMQEALVACGLRPVSNIVDIMNYAMLETGQPLHAFDADKLAERRLVVRGARRGESITTIDGNRFELLPQMLVIADSKHPVAIAGVKGGQGPEVNGSTKRIIVESATFNPVSIYRTSKALNLATDASLRFSHELSPELAAQGLARAAELLIEIAGATPRERFDSRAKPLPSRVLKLDARWVSRFVGVPIKSVEVDRVLERLGFTPLGNEEWRIPPLRTDISTHEDLAEEVVRVRGLNELPAVPPRVEIRPPEINDAVVTREKVRSILTNFGFDEVYLNSFIPESADPAPFSGRDSLVAPENPLSADVHFLRPSLVPNLRTAAENVDDGEVRLFEIGTVFPRRRGDISERESLGLCAVGKQHAAFFALKGVVRELLRGLGIRDLSFIEERRARHALVRVASRKRQLGWLALIPLGTRGRQAAVCELNVTALVALEESEAEYRPISRFPSVMRDISIFVPASVKIGEVLEEIELSDRALITDADLVDEYVDPSRRGKQSIAFRIVFQSADRTLTAEEVDRAMKKIERTLARRFGAEIR